MAVEKWQKFDPFTLDHFRGWVQGLVLDSGRPFRLEGFQEWFVKDVFRGFPECWWIVPQGNGKSTFLAALALYHARYMPDAWVPVAAASRDQARIIYKAAKGFVNRGRLDMALDAGKFRCYDGYRKIDCQGTGSEIEIFAASERTGDGIIPTLCILDELHRHQNLNLYEVWRGKLDKRPGAQLLTISTAGEPGGEFEETREKIRQVSETVERQETFLRAEHEQLVLHEWSVPEEGDVADFDLVARANPLSTVTPAVLEKRYSSPTMTMGNWQRLTCNIPSRSPFAAISEKEWFAAASDQEIPVGEPVWVGADFGWVNDTTSFVPLWVRDSEFRLLGPATILEPPRDGSSLDPNKVKRGLIEIHERNPVDMVVMDMSDARDIASWIEQELGATVLDRGTSNKAAVEDYDRFMEALRNGWLRHTGDRGLSRHVLNALGRMLPQGDTRFERPVQSRNAAEQDRRVIDALVAAAMVHSVATTNQDSVYKERGMVVV